MHAFASNPHLGVASDELGVIDLQEGRESQARREFERGLESDAQCASCKVHLAALLLKAGDSNRATELLRQAVEDEPASEEAHRNLGIVLASAGHLAEASSHLL